MTNIGRRTARSIAVVAVMAAALAACGNDDENPPAGGGTNSPAAPLSGSIAVDGSSTVTPLTEVAAELFNEENPNVQIAVGTSGTGGGFEKFCAGETDISDASRAIEDDEVAACQTGGISYEEFTVANDALTIVVSKENTFATCLTVDQLKKIWEPAAEGTVTNWNQVDPSFPDQALDLYGPGTDSGTFDYFTDVINGEEGASRTDYQPSEDDNVIASGVAGSPGGLGYFGLTYFEENQATLNAVQVDSGNGCVAPSAETAQDGSYTPLARPLYIYPKADSLQRPEVLAFVEYYVENAAQIAEEAGFVPLNATQQADLQADLDRLKSTVG
ncbi:MAG: PstS family phosphate ABC transporter substrate-binding protein [Sporichthyaceae bacterium]|nr:PstS family phosphate ABC transporter substrate-binding protein [Sporichthyaceae bacterium]